MRASRRSVKKARAVIDQAAAVALLGLYEGVPLTERDSWWAAGALPENISFRRTEIT